MALGGFPVGKSWCDAWHAAKLSVISPIAVTARTRIMTTLHWYDSSESRKELMPKVLGLRNRSHGIATCPACDEADDRKGQANNDNKALHHT